MTGEAQAARQLREEASLQLLMVSPNVIASAAILTIIIAPRSYYNIDAAFMLWWTFATFAFGAVREYLHYSYRNATPAGRLENRRWWLLVARHGSTVFGLAFAVMIWVTFPHIDEGDRVAISLLASAWVATGVRLTAPGAGPMVAIVALCTAVVWFLWGGEHGLAGAATSLAFYLIYEPARRRQVGRIVVQISRVRHARQLSEELGERNARLRELNREQAGMLIAASHDLRQPVHALGMLAEEASPTEDFLLPAQRLRLARMQVVVLNEMLRDLTDFSQLEEGTSSVRRSHIHIQRVMRDIAGELESMNARPVRRLDVVDATGQCVDAHSNPEMLNRLLRKLLMGAAHCAATELVKVKLQQLPGAVLEIAIEFTGDDLQSYLQPPVPAHDAAPAALPDAIKPGLADNQLERTARFLGLTLEWGNDHNGGRQLKVLFDPDRLRWGDTAIPSVVTVAPSSGGRGVLLLEDDKDLYLVMAEMLESWGYAVDGGAEMSDAMTALHDRGFVPDLILSDYRLAHGENGLDCIQKIRSLQKAATMPAILLTGDMQLSLSDRPATESITLLHKPLRPSRLRTLLDGLFTLQER